LFSGLIADEDIVRGEKVGINEFISKPFDAKKLILVIDKLLK
jgi:DNA-binding response OmpR family regulator